MSKIVNVIPNNDYTLTITLGNNHQIIYDMEPRLQTVRFGKLTDWEQFKAVRVEHGNTLVWGGLCEITIDEIFSIMER